MTIESSPVHTTIPKKYYEYAKNKKLSWTKLLTRAIEDCMDEDPDLLRNKLNHNKEEREKLLKKLKQAEIQNKESKEKIKEMHRGNIPFE